MEARNGKVRLKLLKEIRNEPILFSDKTVFDNEDEQKTFFRQPETEYIQSTPKLK